ncbi:prolipoprotein diacylglyceryl transferase [Niabella ginsenosidivorans]|uniref:Phosphatidylglycerol--prolipoprotein diacylglyceryl transferase n=1 Tax=Niabella ginsenosidivorans TaxID=1176587 RepID=A0A1A9I4D9_9BACT|nr:prolipoprotein diacylglyceryl transferase [Niabella ginsenosidivorans]ANH82547.1 prolipoprotein diacylglyceryl transferase [Niabella ginsenosidivorans]
MGSPVFSYIHWHPDPELFRIGGLGVRYYSLLFAAGIIIAYLLLKKSLLQQKIPVAVLDKLLIYVVIGTFLGARLGHCLFYEPGYYLHHPLEIFIPWSSTTEGIRFTGYQGLASHGAALGILLSAWIYARKYHFPYMVILDTIAPYIPLAGAVIRLGNLFNSEIIGRPTRVPWAFVFDRVDQVPRHPAQLYESICYFALFLFLYRYSLRKKTTQQKGLLFSLLLTILFSIRFLLEFFKADQEAFEAGMLINMGQLLSLPLIAAGIILLFQRKKLFGA